MAGQFQASESIESASAATASQGGDTLGAGGRPIRTRDVAITDSSRCGFSILRLRTLLPKGSILSVGGRHGGFVARSKRSRIWPSRDTGLRRIMPFVNSAVAP